MKTLEILYIGKDEGHFQDLADRFEKLANAQIHAVRFCVDKFYPSYQSLFVKIAKNKFDIIYIDLLKGSEEAIQLSRMISRNIAFQNKVIVGLVENDCSQEKRDFCSLSGCHVWYLKSLEIHDVVYHPLVLFDPEMSVGEPDYAAVKEERTLSMDEIIRLNYINASGVAVEMARKLSRGDTISLFHPLLNGKERPSDCRVEQSRDVGSYYDKEFKVFLTPIGEDERDQETSEQQGINFFTRQEYLNSWIKKNLEASRSKHVRVLVIDKGPEFFQRTKNPIDGENFLTRYQPFWGRDPQLLKILRPHIIAYNIERSDENTFEWSCTEVKQARNLYNALGNLLQSILTIPNYNPYVIIFNDINEQSKKVAAEVGYQQLLSHSTEFDFETLAKLASMFYQKGVRKDEEIPTKEILGQKIKLHNVFLHKFDPLGLANLTHEIKLLKMQEHQVFFTCKNSLEVGENFVIILEERVNIRIHSVQKEGLDFIYRGFIHGTGVLEKQGIRRFLNSLVFSDHDEQKLKEKEAYDQLNQRVKEKREKERLEKEAKEKKQNESKEPSENN